jgi:hypothetical protein
MPYYSSTQLQAEFLDTRIRARQIMFRVDREYVRVWLDGFADDQFEEISIPEFVQFFRLVNKLGGFKFHYFDVCADKIEDSIKINSLEELCKVNRIFKQ